MMHSIKCWLAALIFFWGEIKYLKQKHNKLFNNSVISRSNTDRPYKTVTFTSLCCNKNVLNPTWFVIRMVVFSYSIFTSRRLRSVCRSLLCFKGFKYLKLHSALFELWQLSKTKIDLQPYIKNPISLTQADSQALHPLWSTFEILFLMTVVAFKMSCNWECILRG